MKRSFILLFLSTISATITILGWVSIVLSLISSSFIYLSTVIITGFTTIFTVVLVWMMCNQAQSEVYEEAAEILESIRRKKQ